MDVPTDLMYGRTHEWARVEDDTVIRFCTFDGNHTVQNIKRYRFNVSFQRIAVSSPSCNEFGRDVTIR